MPKKTTGNKKHLRSEPSFKKGPHRYGSRDPLERLPRGAILIYDRVIRLEGEKFDGKYKGKWFHNFKTWVAVYGLPDGSILIK